MKGELEHGAEHRGAELAFTVHSCSARANVFLPPAILVWLEWSEAPSELIVQESRGVVVVVEEGEPQERCLHHGGSGCRAEGHHLWPPSRGCIPQATLIQSTSVAVVPTTQPPALLSPNTLSSSLVLSLTFCVGCVYFWTPVSIRLHLSSFTKIYFPLSSFSS